MWWPFKKKEQSPTGYTLPKCWEELSRAQFIDVAQILCKGHFEDAGWLKIIWVLSGLPVKIFIKAEDSEHLKRKSELEWIKKIEFSKSFLPELGIGRKIYKGPADDLVNLCFEQYAWADIYAHEYHEKKDFDSVCKLLAALYCEKKFLRTQFNKNIMRMAALPQNIKNAAFVNFLGLQAAFRKRYPLSHAHKEEKSFIENKLNPWDVMVDEITGPKFGTHQDVLAKELDWVFIHFENNEVKRQKMEFENKVNEQ